MTSRVETGIGQLRSPQKGPGDGRRAGLAGRALVGARAGSGSAGSQDVQSEIAWAARGLVGPGTGILSVALWLYW